MENKYAILLNPATNMHELIIHGQTFESDENDSFCVTIDSLKGVNIEELPENVELYLTDNIQNNYTFGFESSINSICRMSNGKCRFTFYEWCDPMSWKLNIDIESFLNLKMELLLHRNEKSPIIEDQDLINQEFFYSIELDGKTIDELIEDASKYDDDISSAIICTVDYIPQLLRKALGIITPQDLLLASE